jgi:hypothetical protein
MNTIPSRSAVLSLLRSFIRNANKFGNYNFREHAKRRAIGGFRLNKDLSKELAADHFFRAQEQLEVVKRQAIVNSLYSEGVSVVQARK